MSQSFGPGQLSELRSVITDMLAGSQEWHDVALASVLEVISAEGFRGSGRPSRRA